MIERAAPNQTWFKSDEFDLRSGYCRHALMVFIPANCIRSSQVVSLAEALFFPDSKSNGAACIFSGAPAPEGAAIASDGNRLAALQSHYPIAGDINEDKTEYRRLLTLAENLDVKDKIFFLDKLMPCVFDQREQYFTLEGHQGKFTHATSITMVHHFCFASDELSSQLYRTCRN